VTASPRDWPKVVRHVRRKVKNAKFELDKKLIHLNAMIVASPPKRVREAIQFHRERLDRDPASYILEKGGAKGQSRAVREAERFAEAAAKYLGMAAYLAKEGLNGSSVIARITSTTMGLATLANGIRAKRGQEVILSIHDFFSWQESWQLRCDRSGLRYREIRLYKDPTAEALEDEILQSVERQIREHTRVLALTWVHSSTGVKLPIRRIGDLLRDVNSRRAPGDRILFCVDGVHGFGVENTSFEDLHCDFLVAGCHKWIFGPRGTGMICALPEAWANVTPTIPSFLGSEMSGALHTPGGVQTYEHVWAMAEAFEFLLDIGKDMVERYTHGLATLLKGGLAAIPGVRVVTPMSPSLSSGIVCCDVGKEPGKAAEDLLALNILAMTAEDADGHKYLRFSPSILNDETQIATALEAVTSVIGP
jgi:isopenicillin-N epimerase